MTCTPRSAGLCRLGLTALTACVLGLAPVRAQTPSADVGVGLFPFLVGNMDGRVQEVVDKCVLEGADSLYVSMFRTTGRLQGDLWVTDTNRQWPASWGPVRPGGAGIDLRALIGYAKSRGLRVVGVVKCFADSVQPTDAAHRQYLLDVIGWIVDRVQPGTGEPTWDLDGIALDYIRFVGSPQPGGDQLVTNLVRDIKARIGALTLHAYLIASRYYIDGPPYDGVTFRGYSQATALLKQDFGQDWQALAQHLDVLMPMCYTADGSIYSSYAHHQNYVRAAARYAVLAAQAWPGTRVQPVVQTYSSSGQTTTQQTVDASITGALLSGAQGFQTFRYATTATSWWIPVRTWSVAGPNLPTPGLSANVQGLSLTVDSRASTDQDQPAGTLQVRYDWNDDGVFDTGWGTPGVVTSLLPSAGPRWIGMRVRDASGTETAVRRQVNAGQVLSPTPGVVLASQGTAVDLRLDAGPAAAGQRYAILGSLSGNSPATPWQPGFDLPLVIDGFSEAALSISNSAAFTNALGTLDPQGAAVARIQLPPPVWAALLFRTVTWAALATDPVTGQPAFVSNPTAFFVVP